MFEFKLPAIGEGVVEGEIVRWLKQPGEAVAPNEGLVEVMTDKATVEIPSPRAGTVKEHRAAEGDIAAVGEVIALLDEQGSAAVATGGSGQADDRPPAAAPATVAPAPSQASTPTSAAIPVVSSTPTPTLGANNGAGRVLATPAARALAREAGIDLHAVAGDRGRITKAHVVQTQAALASGASVAAPPVAVETPAAAQPPSQTKTQMPERPARIGGAPVADERIPFRGMRRRIAEGLVKSYTTAVHYTYVEQIDVTKLVEVRNQAKAAAKAEGVQLSYLPFIVKAVIRGLKKYPMVNAYLDEDTSEIVLRKQYNIGIATATDNGLMVPVVHDADRLSLLDIAAEIARVSEAARTGKAALTELTGSTFTITSLGTIGGVLATPILNYPEVGILGVHAIRKTPVVDENDQIVIGHIMNLSVSLDHRIVDGYEGASFLQEVRRYLEDPTLLLLAGI